MGIWNSFLAFLFKAPASAVKPAPKPLIASCPWVDEMIKVYGLSEITDKVKLSKWLKSDGKTLGDPSKLPWCGDGADTAISIALPKEPRKGDLGKNPYWALNWLYFGEKVGEVFGAVGIFKRDGGGHVGFVIGQNSTHYAVLGANQGDKVSIAYIEKRRCVGLRWPITYKGVKYNLPYRATGTVSTNEL